MSKETGGPAFQGWKINNGVITVTSQMTLRDYFAAKAMQGILAGPNCHLGRNTITMESYLLADAMLKERNK